MLSLQLHIPSYLTKNQEQNIIRIVTNLVIFFSGCPTTECKYCHEIGHILENYPNQSPKSKRDLLNPKISLSQDLLKLLMLPLRDLLLSP